VDHGKSDDVDQGHVPVKPFSKPSLVIVVNWVVSIEVVYCPSEGVGSCVGASVGCRVILAVGFGVGASLLMSA
jgi:hypothetical protein